jgi:hypothetical protein
MKLILWDVSRKDYRFLYKLLKRRKKEECISHKEMPSYAEHCKFIDSAPYKEHCIIALNGKIIGQLYITKIGEIGIHTLGDYYYEVRSLLLDFFKNKARFANISPHDKNGKKLMDDSGYKLIQHTYEKSIR